MRWWLMVVLAVGCVECTCGIQAVDADFAGCVGRERPFHLAWQDCMERAQGTERGDAIVGCAAYARMLICHDVAKRVVPSGQAVDGFNGKLATCERRVGALEKAQSACGEAHNAQEELRFWKRCGVIKDSTSDPTNDQWLECQGMETLADSMCNPRYGGTTELCDKRLQGLFNRMRREGVRWVDCKEGEVCD